MKIHLNSRPHTFNQIRNTFTEQHIKNETMLFSADYDFARRNGDMITHLFLDKLPSHWRDNVIIDTRVHMLMPGFCPCIPGWHHDDVPRTREDGQPNYWNPDYYAEHMLMVIGAHTAPTEFLINEADWEVPPPGRIVYEDWNAEVNRRITHGMGGQDGGGLFDWVKYGLVDPDGNPMEVRKVKDGELMLFDWQTFHRGIPALEGGWRYFARVSRYWVDEAKSTRDYQRVQRRALKNEIRRQVQVYLPLYEKGW